MQSAGRADGHVVSLEWSDEGVRQCVDPRGETGEDWRPETQSMSVPVPGVAGVLSDEPLVLRQGIPSSVGSLGARRPVVASTSHERVPLGLRASPAQPMARSTSRNPKRGGRGVKAGKKRAAEGTQPSQRCIWAACCCSCPEHVESRRRAHAGSGTRF